jgi:hypothetical protein
MDGLANAGVLGLLRLPTSTVSRTSAGLLRPSAAIRSIRPFSAKITLTLMPVFTVKSLNRGSIR